MFWKHFRSPPPHFRFGKFSGPPPPPQVTHPPPPLVIYERSLMGTLRTKFAQKLKKMCGSNILRVGQILPVLIKRREKGILRRVCKIWILFLNWISHKKIWLNLYHIAIVLFNTYGQKPQVFEEYKPSRRRRLLFIFAARFLEISGKFAKITWNWQNRKFLMMF